MTCSKKLRKDERRSRIEHEGAGRAGDWMLRIAGVGEAADEGDLPGQLVAPAAGDHRFALQRGAEIVEP